jgi:hypothetical protein
LPDRASFATQQPYASVGDGNNGVMSCSAQIRLSEQRTVGAAAAPGGRARSAPAMPRRRAPARTSNRCVAAGSSSLN